MRHIFKTAVILLLLSSCRGNHLTKKVEIKDNTLTLIVDVRNDNQVIDYQHSFDITGMTKQQQQSLVQNIYDSLGVK